MSKLAKPEQAAREAVARYFSAPLEKGEGPPGAYLITAGKRVTVEVTAILLPKAGGLTKPHLRFDKVALRLLRDLQNKLGEAVPDGETVIVTVTAPIRLAAKTTDALEDKVRSLLTRRSAQVEVKDTIHANQIRIRRLIGLSRRAPKVVGFVHNPETDPRVLLDLTQALLQHIGAAAEKPAPAQFADARWLVITTKDGPSHLETYRQVYSQLPLPTDFKKILIIFAGGQVETLSG